MVSGLAIISDQGALLHQTEAMVPLLRGVILEEAFAECWKVHHSGQATESLASFRRVVTRVSFLPRSQSKDVDRARR